MLLHAGVSAENIPGSEAYPWYAVKVRTRSEPVATVALRNRGYDAFSPCFREPSRTGDAMKWIEKTAFPGYLFCRFDTRYKAPVLSSPAVEYIVSIGGAPAIIPDEEIESIRRAVEAGARPSAYLAVGQKVRVTHGPLKGVTGMLTAHATAQQLVISVHLLQRSVAVRVHRNQIAAL